MIINHNGQSYLIENWDEFCFKLLDAIGYQITWGIDEQLNKQGIQGASARHLFGSFSHSVNKNILTIESDVAHAVYVEYGSIGRKKGVTDPFGEYNRGAKERKMPPVDALKGWAKVKGIDNVWALAKHIQEYGTPPQAPVRRVIYNKARMEQLITKGINKASK